jgi:Mrp family chromosome partitioning ATPase
MSKNFELLQQTSSEQNLFQTSGNPTGLVDPTDFKPSPAKEKELRKRALERIALPIRWLDAIKEEARRSERPIPVRNNFRRTDLDAITREEEIKLVRSVFSAVGSHSPQTVLFSGVDGEAGSAAICARTSEILAAQTEEPVCVVDANFRSPSLHRYFGVDNFKGLTEAGLESGPIRDFAQQLPGCNLWLMANGSAAVRLRVPQILDRLQSRITELRAAFRYVVIHTSPLNEGSDSMLLSRWTDGVVLVVEANSTRRETARRLKKDLEVANVRLLGVVLNNRQFPIPEALYRRLL